MPTVRVVEIDDPGLFVLPRRKGMPVRPNIGSDLVCRLSGDRPGRALAVLHGRNGETYRTVLDPEGRFDNLLPGRWRLVVTAEGKVLENRHLVLAAGQRHTFTVVGFRPQEVGS
jgi:hypothetical protein